MASAKSQRLAAIYGTDLLNANKAATTSYLEGTKDAGLDLLRQGIDQAKSDLTSTQPQSLAALEAGFRGGREALQDANGAARYDVTKGYDEGLARLSSASARFDPYATAGIGALQTYQGSLGLGGQGARDAAVEAFRAGPGYEFQRDEAVDGAARKASALGLTASGNTLDEITRIGSGLANQEFGRWQDRVSNLATAGQSAAGQQAGYDATGGTMAAQRGTALGGLATGYGNSLAGLTERFQGANADNFATTGRGLSALDMAGGQGGLSALTNLGNQVAGVNTSTAEGSAQLAFEAAKGSDAARSANQALPMQIFSTLANLGGNIARAGK